MKLKDLEEPTEKCQIQNTEQPITSKIHNPTHTTHPSKDSLRHKVRAFPISS